MGKFDEQKWRHDLQEEMGMPPLDVVRGFALDGCSLRVAAGAMGCPIPFLRSLAESHKIRFRHNAKRMECAESPTRAAAVRAWHESRGDLPLTKLSDLTGVPRKTIQKRRDRGLPKHRLVAEDWPGKSGGRKKPC